MTTLASAYGYDDMLHDIVNGVVGAAGDRPDEDQAQRNRRTSMIAGMVMAHLPRDGVETMLSGLCVSYHHLVLDGVRDALLSQVEAMKNRTRSSVVAVGNLLLKTLAELRTHKLLAVARETADLTRERQSSRSRHEPAPNHPADPAGNAEAPIADPEPRTAPPKTSQADRDTDKCPAVVASRAAPQRPDDRELFALYGAASFNARAEHNRIGETGD